MRFTHLTTGGAVALLTVTASAQEPLQVPTPSQQLEPVPPEGADRRPVGEQHVTVTGCLLRQSDLRRPALPPAGVTVVGSDNELVLTHADAAVIGSAIAGTPARLPREAPSTVAAPPRPSGWAQVLEHTTPTPQTVPGPWRAWHGMAGPGAASSRTCSMPPG